jgi:type IV secretion system protein VirD4
MRSSLISVKDIITGAPVTVYITVPPAKLNSHRAVLRLWIGSLLMALMRRTPGLYPNATLILIDETAQLGPMAELETAITLMRGFGIQTWTFWQDLDQIRAIYPRGWRTIINNSSALQCFGVKNAQSAKEIETLMGITDDLTKIGPAAQALKLSADASIIAKLPDPIFADRAKHIHSKNLEIDHGR